jgi:predicted transcriptional regulator of viral defense system
MSGSAPRLTRRGKGKRARRRRFEAYLERVAELVKEGRSIATIASVTRTPEDLVKDTIKLLARSLEDKGAA